MGDTILTEYIPEGPEDWVEINFMAMYGADPLRAHYQAGVRHLISVHGDLQ